MNSAASQRTWMTFDAAAVRLTVTVSVYDPRRSVLPLGSLRRISTVLAPARPSLVQVPAAVLAPLAFTVYRTQALRERRKPTRSRLFSEPLSLRFVSVSAGVVTGSGVGTGATGAGGGAGGSGVGVSTGGSGVGVSAGGSAPWMAVTAALAFKRPPVTDQASQPGSTSTECSSA